MNILIVDDDIVDREHIKRTLSKSDQKCNFIETESVDEGLTAFRKHKFDVILLDYRMPQRDGIEMLLELKNEPIENSVAIIMLSNSEESSLALACLKAGAQDFLLKIEVTAARLNRAIIQAQTRFELERKLYQSYKNAKKVAEHDALTGLANRYAFEETLKLNVNKSSRSEDGISLMLFDLDHFKYVNDTHGHDIGDLLLKEFSVKVGHCLRESELFARIGGDEFAVILRNKNNNYLATKVSERILKSLSVPFHISGIEIQMSVSIGISIYPDNTINADELFKFSDIAMYRAKKLGRNQVCYFEDEMQKQFLLRYKKEQDLTNAITNNQLHLHYQPILCTKKQTLTGFEALLRWSVDDILHMPDDFISIAEESGIILDIGRWVINKAINQLSIWQNYNPSLHMSINLSAIQLADNQLIDCLKNALTKYGVTPKCIEFELTETALLENNDTSTNMMKELNQLGCRIALDDFGTGFSSVSHLQNFPIDTVKIDKSLMLVSSKIKTLSLIKGLSLMLHSLNLEIVAEGIETEEALYLCQHLDIHRVQGYFISKPINVKTIEERYFK
ncbi:two-component system response regulator [Colwellia sp. E150_009]